MSYVADGCNELVLFALINQLFFLIFLAAVVRAVFMKVPIAGSLLCAAHSRWSCATLLCVALRALRFR